MLCMMDHQKKATVLNYITAVSGKRVNSLLDLKNGHFYMQVLGLLDQWNNKENRFTTDQDRLICLQTFLQDYYGPDVRIEEFLKFDAVLGKDSTYSESDIELELAKIAVVLLGIGVLDKNGYHFIGSAMQLPSEMHFDVMAIIQSVVQAGSTEVSLTDNIEKVLLEPSVNIKSPPVCSLQKSHFTDPDQTSTPKQSRRFRANMSAATPVSHRDSPLGHNTSVLNNSLQEIMSPLRGLTIDIAPPSSPLAQFVQSPQLHQKAVLKQKELKIRKLKQQLNDQVILKDELQFSLQDKTAECVNKDGEICKLRDEIKKLLQIKESCDECQGLKKENSEMERQILRLNKKLQSCQRYKEECQLLEKENSSHYEEVKKLHQEIAALQTEANKYRDSMKTISNLEMQVTSLQLQMDSTHRSKTDWDSERAALQANLELAKETVEKLRQEMDDMLIKQEAEVAPGESMGIFMDIQLGEVRCQLEELSQEKELLLQQLYELTTKVSIRDCELDELKNSLCDRDGIIAKLNETLTGKGEDIERMKEAASIQEQNIESLQGVVNTYQHEIESLKEVTDKKNEQINVLEDAQSMLQEQLERLKHEIKAKEAECSDSISKATSLSDRITLLEDELEKKNRSYITLCDTKTNLESVLDKKENEMSGLCDDLTAKCDMLSQLQADMNVAQEQLQNQEMEVGDLRCKIEKQKEKVAEVEQQLQTKSAAVDMLTESLNVKTAEFTDLQARELLCVEEAKSLQATCVKLSDENEEYKQLVNNIRLELEQVRYELTTRNTEMINVSEIVNSLKEEKLSIQKQFLCMEERSHLLETQLKEQHISLQNTVQQLAEREKLVTEKELAEQEISRKLSQATLLLQERADEISSRNNFIDSMKEEHKSELSSLKQETENRMRCLQDKLDVTESELKALAKQKIDLESQMTSLVVEHKERMSELTEDHLKAISNVETHYQETESAKEAEKLQLEQQLKSCGEEMKSLNLQASRYEQQLMKMDEIRSSLKNALKIERDTHVKMQKRMESCNRKYEDMKAQHESVLKENKSYASEVNRLKTALDYSDRKLQEYHHQLDQAGTALLGDSSHFEQLLEEKRISDSKTDLKKTVSSGMSLVKRDWRTGTTDLQKKLRQTEDRTSIYSTASSQSIQSITSRTAVAPSNAFSCIGQTERAESDQDRMSELRRRNTMCLPHLKSAYPLEMQVVSKFKATQNSLRWSLLPNKMSPTSYTWRKEHQLNSNKRKAAIKGNVDNVFSESPPKQIRTEPPAPGQQCSWVSPLVSCLDVAASLPGGKISLISSPAAPPNPHPSHAPSKHLPRRSPRINSQSPACAQTVDEHQESVTFNIGFTPKKSNTLRKLTRHKGLLSREKDKATTAVTRSTSQLRKGRTGQQTVQVYYQLALGTLLAALLGIFCQSQLNLS